jgi:hypothetical protein
MNTLYVNQYGRLQCGEPFFLSATVEGIRDNKYGAWWINQFSNPCSGYSRTCDREYRYQNDQK